MSAQSAVITNNSFKIQSLSSAQIQSIAAPQKGMMVFDNELKTLRYFDGVAWLNNNTQQTNFEGQNMAMFRGNASNYDSIYDMKIDAEGNVYVLNSYYGTVTYNTYSFANTHPILAFYCLVKFSPTGQILWAKDLEHHTYGPLAIDNDGNIYINGQKYLTDGTADPSNNIQWMKPTFAPNGNVYGYGGIESYNQTINNITFGCPGIQSGANKGLFAIDASKNLLWVNYSCNNSLNFDATFSDDANNCYFMGYLDDTIDFSGGANTIRITTIPGQRKHFIGKYSMNGDLLWVKSIKNTPVSGSNDAITHQTHTGFDSEGNILISIGFKADNLYYNENIIVSTNICPNPESYGVGNAIQLRINSTTGALIASQKDFGGTTAESASNYLYTINAIGCPLSNEVCPPKNNQKIMLKKDKTNGVIWVTKTTASLSAIAKGADKSIWIGGSFTTGNLTFGSNSLTTARPSSMFLLRIKE